jgi:hypothetical protein
MKRSEKAKKAEAAARERNRAAQAAYRDRQGETLRKARRVGSALMSLRSERGYYRMNGIARALRAFLTQAEVAQLVEELNTGERAPKQSLEELATGIKSVLAKSKRGGPR